MALVTVGGLALLDTPERVATALPALRRRLLERLRHPASASELAREFGVPRQRLNYHLRVLEGQRLLELVELRRRRGFTERVLRTVGDGLVVDPAILVPGSGSDRAAGRDRHAAEHLVAVAGATVRDVARMSDQAARRRQCLLTFTIETEVRFASPADLHTFTDALASAVADVAARFDTAGGRAYRVLAAGHPATVPESADTAGGPDG